MNLFVYGTLLVPKIWNIVSDFPSPESEEAQLPGYSIYRVEDGDFPGVIETPDSTEPVRGLVMLNISPEAMQRLDDYEGSFYVRNLVEVTTEKGDKVQAYVYAIPQELAYILSDEHWTLDWFEKEALDRYWEGHWG